MNTDPALEKLLGLLKTLGALVPKRAKKAELIFKYEPRDFPPCHTRILREGRGFPWDHQVAGHRDFSGHFELKPIERPKAAAKPDPKRKRLE